MQLAIDSDASYLSESKARSRVAGYHFLTDAPLDPDKAPEPDNAPLPFNGPVHILSKIATPVLASAAEAEFAGLYRNGQEGCTLRTTLIEMGHPQLPTRIKPTTAPQPALPMTQSSNAVPKPSTCAITESAIASVKANSSFTGSAAPTYQSPKSSSSC
jgi:hypothetical protein